MSQYNPHVWVVLKFTTPSFTIYKVFGGWYGGYAASNSWKLNSGIVAIRRDGDWFEFDGNSGSTYRCSVNGYRMSGFMQQEYDYWQNQCKNTNLTIEILSLDEVAKL